MRETGFIGLFQVIFRCVRDGISTTHAWAVMAGFALLAIIPIALIVGLLWLITWLVAP